MVDDRTNEILKEILKWEELQGKKLLIDLIPELLDGDEKKRVFEMTDGKNSQSAIASRIKVAGGTVSNWWNIWHSYGILIKEKNRYKKIISLKEIGISISELKGKKSNNSNKNGNK